MKLPWYKAQIKSGVNEFLLLCVAFTFLMLVADGEITFSAYGFAFFVALLDTHFLYRQKELKRDTDY